MYEIIEQKKNKNTKQTKSNTEDEDTWGEAESKKRKTSIIEETF